MEIRHGPLCGRSILDLLRQRRITLYISIIRVDRQLIMTQTVGCPDSAVMSKLLNWKLGKTQVQSYLHIIHGMVLDSELSGQICHNNQLRLWSNNIVLLKVEFLFVIPTAWWRKKVWKAWLIWKIFDYWRKLSKPVKATNETNSNVLNARL